MRFLILFIDECTKDSDCPFEKSCFEQKCINPCQRRLCGIKAECKVEYHQARCLCPKGLQGNPIVECLSVGCQQDADCNEHERCERNTQECVPLCHGNPCAAGAECFAQSHKEDCRCVYPLQGDGFNFCTQSKTDTL